MLSQKICTTIGISQRTLAAYLQMDQSILNRYERGEKNIPTNKLLQLVAINTALEQLSETTVSPTVEDLQHVEQQMQYCQLQLLLINQQIEKASKHWQQAQKLLALCTHLLQQDLNKKQLSWVQQQQYAAQQTLKKYNWLAMQQLFLKQKTLQQEKMVYEMLLK